MYMRANPAFPTPSFSFKANRYTQGWKTATSTLSVHVSPTDKSFVLAVCWEGSGRVELDHSPRRPSRQQCREALHPA